MYNLIRTSVARPLCRSVQSHNVSVLATTQVRGMASKHEQEEGREKDFVARQGM